jgi:hypothetical protein
MAAELPGWSRIFQGLVTLSSPCSKLAACATARRYSVGWAAMSALKMARAAVRHENGYNESAKYEEVAEVGPRRGNEGAHDD